MKIILADNSNLEDLAVLFDGYRQFYRQTPDLEAAKAFVAERLKNKDSVVFMAFQNNSAIGFVQLYPIFSSVSMGRAWLLNDLYVAPQARQSGAGKMLMDAAAEHGRKTHAKFLMLQTEITNSTAQKLYEKQGWQRDEECYYYFLKPQ